MLGKIEGAYMELFKLIVLGVIALFAAIAADWGHDLAYQLHAFIIMLIAAGMFIWVLRGVGEAKQNQTQQNTPMVSFVLVSSRPHFGGLLDFLPAHLSRFSLHFLN